MSNDPIDELRHALDASRVEPTAADVAAQRTRLRAAMEDAAPRRQRSRRLIPVSGIAVVVLACIALVVVALRPSSEHRSATHRSTFERAGGIAGGAFAGIDLKTASAAEVLDAAGRSAAAGTPSDAGAGWSYTRIEQHLPRVQQAGHKPGTFVTAPLTTVTERWTSPDGRENYSITGSSTPRGRVPMIAYENLSAHVVGNVGWSGTGYGSAYRQASWDAKAGVGQEDIELGNKLHEGLRDVRTGADVGALIDGLLDASSFTFRGGMACLPHGPCMSIGVGPVAGNSVADSDSRPLYAQGLLIQAIATNVYPARTTKAIYAYLASLDGVVTTPAPGSSNDVLVKYRTHGAKPALIEEATLDGTTGRIVKWGTLSAQYTQVGVASAPTIGGELCSEFTEACGELHELYEARKHDPRAAFRGAKDWMLIAQQCDGLLDAHGKAIPGAGPGLSSSKDPAVRKRYDDCVKSHS